MRRRSVAVAGIMVLVLTMVGVGTGSAGTMPSVPNFSWLHDTGSGGTTTAETGGHDGQRIGGSPWSSTTKFSYTGNNSIELDGVNYQVRVSDSNTVPRGASAWSNFTVSAWVRCDDTVNYNTIIGDWTGDTGGQPGDPGDKGSYALRIDAGGNVRATVWHQDTDAPRTFVSLGQLTQGAWSHVVMVSSNFGSTLTVYINNAAPENNTSGTLNWRPTSAMTTIGGFFYHSANYFDGLIDEIGIWDHALTADEVDYLYTNSLMEVTESAHVNKGVMYTAEDDTTSATDKYTEDGAQNGTFSGGTLTVSAVNPKFGSSAYRFAYDADASVPQIEIADSSTLGRRFTLAAWVDTTSYTTYQRLFAVFEGGVFEADEVMLGYRADGSGINGIRFTANTVATIPASAQVFTDGLYHHMAATYDNGAVKVYLDGSEVASGTAGGGAVNARFNMKIGNDDSTSNTAIQGDVDDVVMLRRVLSASEINELMTVGAQSFLYPPPVGTTIVIR